MFSRIDFVHMPHEGWMNNDSSFIKKMNEIVLTQTLFPTPLGGF
jgi:hypothetical protein